MKNSYRIFLVHILISVPLLFTSCIQIFDNINKGTTYYNLDVYYYVFIEDDNNEYSDSECIDKYIEADDTYHNMFDVERGKKRYLWETYPSSEFGKALYKSIVTNKNTELPVYLSANFYSKYGTELPKYDANFTITIADEELGVDEKITGEFQNDYFKESFQECTVENEKLGTVHILCIYSYDTTTEY